VLTNAQEHPGITDWTLIGYFDTKTQQFEVAIINFGKTISETFLELARTSYTYRQVGGYVSRIRRLRTGRKFSEQALVTVAALQGQISSKNKSTSDTRGQGSVEMVEFFQVVSENSDKNVPQMVMISGSTHITFDPKYKMGEWRGRPYTIAFNASNTLDEPPDARAVNALKNVFFPGTIIAIRFPLLPQAIMNAKVEEYVEDDHN
jgi:hypothetical protein